ncbi:hypothetical protein RJ639_018287, partial [Escallonia herrerae]
DSSKELQGNHGLHIPSPCLAVAFNLQTLQANFAVQTLKPLGTAQNGFSATSCGNAKDQVYGLAQCRGDVSSNDCLSCIQDASKEIRKRCPDQADARIWYEYCFLRYNTKNFLGEVDTSYGIFYYNTAYVTDPDAFNEELGALMDRIKSQAVGPFNKGLGKGESKLSPFETLYALVQCTRDLSQLSCSQCLAIATGNFPTFCNSKKGCRVLYRSCYVRYELYPFFFPLDSRQTLASTSMASYVSVVVSKTEEKLAESNCAIEGGVITCRFDNPLGQFCGSNTKTTRQISSNIDAVLAKLVQGTAQNGFSATSYGNAKDQVYGLAQCRGDVSSNDCLSCIQDASEEIRKRCPDQADARIWYDYCFLSPNGPDKSQAVAPFNKGLGKGESKLSPFETLDALVQCTRDLSQLSCSQCLAIAIGNFPTFCNSKKGCRVLYGSCYVRYELYPFFFPLDS